MPPTGPRITRYAVDLFRVEKFKIEGRSKLTQSLAQHLDETLAARERTVEELVSHWFAMIWKPVEQAIDDVHALKAQLQSDRQRRIATREHERRHREQLDEELVLIQARARDLARKVANIPFRVQARKDVAARL